MSELNDLVAQFEKYSKMATAADPLLELEIDKLKTALKNMGVSPEDAAILEAVIRDPMTAEWKPGPPLPSEPMLDFEPTQQQIDFFKEMIRTAAEGCVWGIPATGHEYRIEKAKQQFVLIRDVEHDPDRWHQKTKMILALLGWAMVDDENNVKSLVALKGNWSLGVFDFPVDRQENPKTPGQNFPPGTRGQDAVATLMGSSLVRLGPQVSYTMWKKLNTLTAATGAGKTSAPWTHKKES